MSSYYYILRYPRLRFGCKSTLVLRVSGGNQTASLDAEGTIAARREGRVVGHDNGCEQMRPMQVLKQGEDFFAGARVEVPGRFVGEEYGRVAGERPSERRRAAVRRLKALRPGDARGP